MFKKPWLENTCLILVAVVGVYGSIYFDVVSRAKEAYQEAEKYMDWNRHPDKKIAYFESKFQSEKAGLDGQLAKKKINHDDYSQKLDTLEFDKNFALQESSLKYAYQWYKDTYELFSPPESKWVKMARAKTPEALQLWKEELTAKNVPFEDYMFE